MRIYTKRAVIDRVLDRTVESEVGCWIFKGALSEGYGKVGLGGRGEGIDFTHRVTWRYFRGEIPEGLDLDHLCRNRACCNPWHLEPVSRKVNVARGLQGTGWALKGRTHCKHGHEFTQENTAIVRGHVRDCRACRRRRYAESVERKRAS